MLFTNDIVINRQFPLPDAIVPNKRSFFVSEGRFLTPDIFIIFTQIVKCIFMHVVLYILTFPYFIQVAVTDQAVYRLGKQAAAPKVPGKAWVLN